MAERAGPALCWTMTVHAENGKWRITSEVQPDQSLPYTLLAAVDSRVPRSTTE
jgi:hypothetical protein